MGKMVRMVKMVKMVKMLKMVKMMKMTKMVKMVKPLSERRRILAKKFARKASKRHFHSSWFITNPEEQYPRLRKPTYKPVSGRTAIILSYAIPYMTNLLNETQ